MQRVVNILTARGIDTADEQITEISSTDPALVLLGDRDLPIMSLCRQAVQDRLGEGLVLHVVLQKKSLCFGSLRLQLTQGSDVVTGGIPRVPVPGVDGDKDALTDEIASLPRADSDLWNPLLHGQHKHGLLSATRE
jgi:hypothetical protein